jgi:ABC-type glycerol-3-phosphate transport system substrate-binding protein
MKLRPFELGLVITFGGLALLAMFLLATADPAPPEPKPGELVAVGPVTIWGTLPAGNMSKLFSELQAENKAYESVTYRYLHPSQFDQALITALADGVGPDLIMVSHEKLATVRHRIQPILEEQFPTRDVRDFYIDGAQIFALSDGLYAYPLAVDPLMMYWNRDILTNAGFLEPPATWEALVTNVFPELIKRDFDRTIERSVVAMGEYRNIRNAFGVISALFIQSGSAGVVETGVGNYSVQLQRSVAGAGDPLRTAVDFYTRFSKPGNALYSWNRSFTSDLVQFSAEDLAIYFGYGSEAVQIEQTNPNLSFDIASFPQGADATVRRTYGKFYGVSLLRTTDNYNGALQVMSHLGGAAQSAKIAAVNNMAPVHRGVLSQGSNDTYGRVIYAAAPITFGWLNPSQQVTSWTFQTMVEDVNENRRDASSAAADAVTRLSNSY